MRIRPLVLLVIIATSAVASGQSPLPAGIHPESLSRLPPVQRAGPGRGRETHLGRAVGREQGDTADGTVGGDDA